MKKKIEKAKRAFIANQIAFDFFAVLKVDFYFLLISVFLCCLLSTHSQCFFKFEQVPDISQWTVVKFLYSAVGIVYPFNYFMFSCYV